MNSGWCLGAAVSGRSVASGSTRSGRANEASGCAATIDTPCGCSRQWPVLKSIDSDVLQENGCCLSLNVQVK